MFFDVINNFASITFFDYSTFSCALKQGYYGFFFITYSNRLACFSIVLPLGKCHFTFFQNDAHDNFYSLVHFLSGLCFGLSDLCHVS